jgi:hypothetical protein
MACDLYPTEGFSHYATSMTAPIASGRSENCRVGFAPTEKRRLSTAHADEQTFLWLRRLRDESYVEYRLDS